MLSEAFNSLKSDKTLHTHQVLLVLGTMLIKLPLVPLGLEADFTGVMAGSYVQLKFQERGQIHLVTHLTSKPGLGSGGSGWARTYVGDKRTIVEKDVLTNIAS